MENVPLSLLERIRSGSGSLSPAQRVVSDYILSSYKSLAYVTLAELARLTSTGQGTVVRFAQALGYGSFSNFRSALREEIERGAPRSLEIYSSKSANAEDAAPFDIVFEMERSLMDETYSLIKKEEFNAAVMLISDAPALIVAASGSNSFLAEYAGYFLGTMKENVSVIKENDLRGMNILLDAPPGTAALVFSFPRYPIKTQSVVKVMRERGIRILGISDSQASPIAEYCDPLLKVPQKFMTFMDPCAAVMSLVHSILYGVWLRDRERCRDRIEARKRLFEGEKLFVSENISLPDLTP